MIFPTQVLLYVLKALEASLSLGVRAYIPAIPGFHRHFPVPVAGSLQVVPALQGWEWETRLWVHW